MDKIKLIKLILLVIISIIITKTDNKTRKIPNKFITTILFIGFLTDLFTFNFNLISKKYTNILIVATISIFFWKINLLRGGDSKLIPALIVLSPLQFNTYLDKKSLLFIMMPFILGTLIEIFNLFLNHKKKLIENLKKSLQNKENQNNIFLIILITNTLTLLKINYFIISIAIMYFAFKKNQKVKINYIIPSIITTIVNLILNSQQTIITLASIIIIYFIKLSIIETSFMKNKINIPLEKSNKEITKDNFKILRVKDKSKLINYKYNQFFKPNYTFKTNIKIFEKIDNIKKTNMFPTKSTENYLFSKENKLITESKIKTLQKLKIQTITVEKSISFSKYICLTNIILVLTNFF